MILNSKLRGYLFGENGICFSLPYTSVLAGFALCTHVKKTYKVTENGAIRKISKTGVTTPSGCPEQRLLRKFKQPVNTEFFSGNFQSCNFAARLDELLEQRQEPFPATHASYIYNKV